MFINIKTLLDKNCLYQCLNKYSINKTLNYKTFNFALLLLSLLNGMIVVVQVNSF